MTGCGAVVGVVVGAGADGVDAYSRFRSIYLRNDQTDLTDFTKSHSGFAQLMWSGTQTACRADVVNNCNALLAKHQHCVTDTSR